MRRKPLLVAGVAPCPQQPTDRPLDHPAPGKRDERGSAGVGHDLDCQAQEPLGPLDQVTTEGTVDQTILTARKVIRSYQSRSRVMSRSCRSAEVTRDQQWRTAEVDHERSLPPVDPFPVVEAAAVPGDAAAGRDPNRTLERVLRGEFSEFLVAGEGGSEGEDGEEVFGFAFVAQGQAAVSGEPGRGSLVARQTSWQGPFVAGPTTEEPDRHG